MVLHVKCMGIRSATYTGM